MSQRENHRRTCEISQAVDSAQVHMFQIAYAKHGFSRKILSSYMDVSDSTIREWEKGTSMPFHAVVKLAMVPKFPNHLLSLMIEPAGKVIADANDAEADIDDLARAAVDMLQRYVAARHPDSPSGIAIDHTEKGDIREAARGLEAHARKVSA